MAETKTIIVTHSNKAMNICMFAIGIVALLFSLISPYSVILVLFGLLPSLIAMIIDPEKDGCIWKMVTLFNSIGILPYLIKISKSSGSAFVLEIIINPQTWMVIFTAASIGWILYWIFPQIAVLIKDLKINAKIAKLEKELDDLAKEWGEEIKPVSE